MAQLPCIKQYVLGGTFENYNTYDLQFTRHAFDDSFSLGIRAYIYMQ